MGDIIPFPKPEGASKKGKRGPSSHQRFILNKLKEVNAAPSSALVPPGCSKSVAFQCLEMLEHKGLIERRKALIGRERIWALR
jgi:hypothetical protein